MRIELNKDTYSLTKAGMGGLKLTLPSIIAKNWKVSANDEVYIIYIDDMMLVSNNPISKDIKISKKDN